MSEAGPSSRTRAASQASRESTPAPVNQNPRAGHASREATPAKPSRATKRRQTNRATPAPRDGDNALPPVSNQNSKAYGSSGKLKAPVQMDVDQVFRPPEMAIDAALAQSNAMGAGHLPTVAEDAGENQASINQQLQHDLNNAVQNTRGNQGYGNSEVDGQEIAGQTAGPFDISAWATRVAEERTWFGRLKRCVIGILTMIHAVLVLIFGSVAGWLMGMTARDRAYWFAYLLTIFVFFDFFYGPLHPLLDSASMRAARPSTGNYRVFQKPVNASRILSLENQISTLNSKILNVFNVQSRAAAAPQINWFEVGQGASIDPILSSPSYRPQDDFTVIGYFTALFILRKQVPTIAPFSSTPIEALMHWNDGGLERWCAPASRGKLQLTVNSARPIAPKELIVEHIAKDASIYIGTAPRELEFWVEINNPDVRAELYASISASMPSLLELSSPQIDKELADAQALPPNLMLVGRFYYDIHTNQAVQSFDIPFDLASFGIKSTRFAVRVNSNWGSYDATCINRLRLHATDMSGEKELLEDAF